MASGSKETLQSLVTHAAATTTTGDTKVLETYCSQLILVSTISDFTAGSFVTKIQHSPDGVNWLDLDTCAAQTANGVAIKAITVYHFIHVRSIITSTGGTVGGKAKADLFFNTSK